MKLLLDQGLPRSAAKLLNKSAINTIHVCEIGYATATDDMILQLGRKENYIIVTLDADFHALLALSAATKPSVIRIRIEGLKGEAVAKLLKIVINKCAHDLEYGATVTVQKNRIRLRHLPLNISKKK